MSHNRFHRTINRILLFQWIVFMVSSGYSQEMTKSNVRIIQDDRVDLLVSKHIQINQNRKGINGFRIQIFFDSGNNSKTSAQAIYTGFTVKYPDIPAYL